MPIEVHIYQEADGAVPVRDWLLSLEEAPRARCVAALALLEEYGHTLRRPHVENLGDDIYELRTKYKRVNLRLLYFFHEQKAVVVTNGFTKERTIPPAEINLAQARKALYLAAPAKHTYRLPGKE